MPRRSSGCSATACPTWGRLDGEHGRARPTEASCPRPTRTSSRRSQPTKILATHLTYQSRVTEYAMARPPQEPAWFLKPPSALNGHRQEIRRPAGARYLNYEGELAVVVGRRMKGVSEADALDYVAGYAPANDVGLHDFRHADRGAMVRVKGQDGFLPIGPAITHAQRVRPDELHDPHVPQRRAGPGGRQRRPHVRRRLPARRPLPGHHARARRRDPHRHAGQLAGRWSPATSSRSRSTASAA